MKSGKIERFCGGKKEKNESNAIFHTKFLHVYAHSEGGSDGKKKEKKNLERRKRCERETGEMGKEWAN